MKKYWAILRKNMMMKITDNKPLESWKENSPGWNSNQANNKVITVTKKPSWDFRV